jgi:hydrogenase nickel incorporation protein HypA/HybF
VHELSLSRAIGQIATRAAAGRRVTRVEVDCGALRQVVPETLTRCWGLTVEGTALAGSELVVNPIPAVIRCAACGAETRLDWPILRCGRCDSTEVTLLSGEEFLVRSIDVGT